jgi:hypothetical protein
MGERRGVAPAHRVIPATAELIVRWLTSAPEAPPIIRKMAATVLSIASTVVLLQERRAVAPAFALRATAGPIVRRLVPVLLPAPAPTTGVMVISIASTVARLEEPRGVAPARRVIPATAGLIVRRLMGVPEVPPMTRKTAPTVLSIASTVARLEEPRGVAPALALRATAELIVKQRTLLPAGSKQSHRTGTGRMYANI